MDLSNFFSSYPMKNSLARRGVRVLFLGGIALAFGACNTPSKNTGDSDPSVKAAANPNGAKKYTADQVDPSIISDLARHDPRSPAQEAILAEMKFVLGDLRKVSPHRFAIYVFPKVSKQNRKSMTDNEIVLGKPSVVEVSPVAVNKCSAFSKDFGGKWHPKDYYPAELVAAESTRLCAILEFTDIRLRDLDKALLRNGDVLKKRIYLDDRYLAYGIEADVISGKRTVTLIKNRLDPEEGISSALEGIPVDLPVLTNPQSNESKSFDFKDLAVPANGQARIGFDPARPLDRLMQSQILKIDQKYKVSACQGRSFSYIDSMRKNVKVYWCSGMPWPQAVETGQYFAVTQNLETK